MNIDSVTQANKLYSDKCYEEAMVLYKQCAEEGNYGCSRVLGWMYFLGEGVERDIEKAKALFHVAADNDDLEAIFGLGRIALYEDDCALAIKYYVMANDLGFSPATYRLGWIYINSQEFVNKDKGVAYLTKASKKGHVRALRDLSVLQIKSPYILVGLMNYLRFIIRLVSIAVRDTQDERLLF